MYGYVNPTTTIPTKTTALLVTEKHIIQFPHARTVGICKHY